MFAVGAFLFPGTKEVSGLSGEEICVKASRLNAAREGSMEGALVGLLIALFSGVYEMSGYLGNLICKKIGLED